MQKELLKLFEGDSSQFITVSLTGETDERGKKKADYLTVHEPVTEKLWADHIKGDVLIGIRPENGDKLRWSCIDIDPANYKAYSQKKYVDIVRDFDLPLVPVKSKSGGLHLFIFFSDWADKVKVKAKLEEINKEYFLSKEVFPLNKAVGMPYHKADAAIEYAFDDQNTPLMLGGFIELAKKKTVDPTEFLKAKITEYNAETDWREYPPCVQKVIQEGWTGERNNMLFNICVTEMKKAEGSLTVKQLKDIAWERQKSIYANHPKGPLKRSESDMVAQSVHTKGYEYFCPPKHGFVASICDKETCKLRKLGIGVQAPDIKNDFTNIIYTQDTKGIIWECDFRDTHISFRAEDIKDQKTWRTCLAKHRIYWLTLPRPKKGPDPFELLMKHIVESAVENTKLRYEDTLEEEQYQTLKDFFETTIEQDDFNKLKDGYTVLDSKTNIVYFKRATLDRFLKRTSNKAFASVVEALRLLKCDKHDYHEGEKNVWYVTMPEFVNHQAIKQTQTNTKNLVSEMDDQYHTKFRTPKA